MSVPNPPRRRRLKVCTECRRRKQKCDVSPSGSQCGNCAKRWPPVECIFPRTRAPVPGAPIGLVELVGAGDTETSGNSNSLALICDGVPRSASFSTPERDDARQTAVDDLAEILQQRLILDGRGAGDVSSPFTGIITEISASLNGSSLPNTARTADLLHFYLRFVVPNIVSIDGERPPTNFMRSVVPWMLQSPIYPTVGLMISSTIQAMVLGGDPDAVNRETIALKARAFSQVATFIETTNSRPGAWSEEVMGCVLNLIVFEWLWGSDKAMEIHLKGARDMIRAHGGWAKLAAMVQDEVKTMPVVLADYFIACSFERGLYMLDGDRIQDEYKSAAASSHPITRLSAYCPLVSSSATFSANAKSLRIPPFALGILDDIRFLTTSIVQSKGGDKETARICETASWLHDRLAATQSGVAKNETSHMDAAVRLAASIYAWAVSSRKPLSAFRSETVREDLITAVQGVRLSWWKEIPGINLWIVLVACSGVPGDVSGRFWRRKAAVATSAIAFENFALAVTCLSSFQRVQGWLVAGEGEPGDEGSTGLPTLPG